jgi:hypothetical protein
MKPNPALLLCLAFAAAFFSGCKKDAKDIDTNEVRLLGYEIYKSGEPTIRMNIGYDNNGRINKLIDNTDANAPRTVIAITYSGNEVIIVPIQRQRDNSDITEKDTTWLHLDANQRLAKRIAYEFYDFKTEPFLQKLFKYDTINYQYDAAGLLLKKVQHTVDSSWMDQGDITSSATRTESITTYTNGNGNANSSNTISRYVSVSKAGGQTFTNITTGETNDLYEYSKAYQNRIDFLNAAVLDELFFFTALQLNRNYKNMPDKITGNTVKKSSNGTIFYTDNYVVNYQFGYNDYGFITARLELSNPDSKTVFVYNK